MQMQEKTMVADTLTGINGELVRFGEMIPQTENKELKQTLKQFRNACEQSQEELYQIAREKSYYDVKPWRGKLETAGGGCMINQSVHTLDLLYHLGGPIEELKASVSRILDYGIEVEDTVAASLTYANGAHGLFMATNANYKNESVQISVQMEKAEFAIIDNVLYRIDAEGNRERLVEDERLPGTKFYYGASHGKLIARFYREIETGGRDYVLVKDAVTSMRLIDGILESGRTGKKVAI